MLKGSGGKTNAVWFHGGSVAKAAVRSLGSFVDTTRREMLTCNSPLTDRIFDSLSYRLRVESISPFTPSKSRFFHLNLHSAWV